MYGPKKGFAQSSYYDQQATAIAGMLANASDYNFVDSAIVKEDIGYIEAGLCVAVERSTDVMRPGINYDRLVMPTGSSGYVVSGAIDFGNLNAIADGKVDITVDSAKVQVSGLDFTSSITDLDTLASTLESKLSGKAVVEPTAFGIVIRSVTTGATSTVAVAAGTASGGTDVSALLKLTSASGATTVNGAASEFGGILVRNQQMQTTEEGIAAIEGGRMANYARAGRSGARIWVQAWLGNAAVPGGKCYMVVQADTATYPGVKVGMVTDSAMSSKAVEIQNARFVDIFAPSKGDNANFLALVELM